MEGTLPSCCPCRSGNGVKAQIECAGNFFTASGKTVVCAGFKAYEAALRRQFQVAAEKGDDENTVSLPEITEGMALTGAQFTVSEGFTQAPKRSTEVICYERGIRNRP